jgi:intein/homing endonuclease
MCSASEIVEWNNSINQLMEEKDIIAFQRPTDLSHIRLIRKAKLMGKKTVQICDDLYLVPGVPDWNSGFRYYKDRQGFIKQSLREVDALDVTTPYLEKIYKDYNRKIGVLPNCLDVDLVDVTPAVPDLAAFNRQGQKVTHDFFEEQRLGKKFFLWGGSPTHERDLELVVSAMRRLVRSEDICLGLMGYVHRAFLEIIPQNQLFLFSLVPCAQYFMVYKAIRADFGLAPVVEVDFNKGKCITGDSRVSTDMGLVRIDQLSNNRTNDFIDYSCEGLVSTRDGSRRFSGFYSGGIQDCIKITTKCGYSITGSLTHKVLSENGWKRLSQFKIGDLVYLSHIESFVSKYVDIHYPLFMHKLFSSECLNTFTENAPSIRISEDWGRFLGYMVGDGTINGYNVMGISCSALDPDIIEDVSRLVASFGLHPKIIEKKDPRIRNEDGSVKIGLGRDVKFTSRPMVLFMQHIGLAGRKTKNLIVPECIFHSPKSVIREFLRGLFESDGTISKNLASIQFCTKHQQLAKDVQFLLLLFGIKSKLRIKTTKLEGWTNGRDYSYVVLNAKSTRIFNNEIGFISLRKSQRLQERCSMRMSNNVEEWDWTDEIVSIEPCKQDVFDISVPKGEQYIANGIVIHNSNLKSIELMCINVLPIMSDFVTYQGCSPRGFYAKNDEYSWFKTMRDAIHCEDYQDRITENKKFVDEHFDIKKNIVLWESFYGSL